MQSVEEAASAGSRGLEMGRVGEAKEEEEEEEETLGTNSQKVDKDLCSIFMDEEVFDGKKFLRHNIMDKNS